MYRKYYQNDELSSNVLVAFALFVMFGIMFYFIYYDTGGFTPSSILYLVFCSTTFLLFIFHLVVYVISHKKRILDYEIDLDNEIISFSKRRRIPFDKIKLYANRNNRSEVKIFYKTKILNIILFQLQDDNGNKLTYELSESINKYAKKIGHRQLYNYNFMFMFLTFAFNLIFVIIQDSFTFIPQTYRYFTVLGATAAITIIFIGINVFRLNHTYRLMVEKDQTNLQEDIKDTSL